MERTSNVEKFPFLIKGVNYFELIDNELIDLGHEENKIKEAYLRAKNNQNKLYITWHGVHRTDMFFVDNLNQLGQAFGFEKPDHYHHMEWRYRDEVARGGYITVDIIFKCGCNFDYIGGTEQLKRDLLIQKGWQMSGSGGVGGYNGKYSISVLKSSIKD